MMQRWNDIIREPEPCEKRLKDLLGVWADIIELYDNPMIMYFEQPSFRAVMDSSYNRIYYPSNTTSVIKTSNEVTARSNKDKIIKYMSEDENNYRLVKALASIFNDSLVKEQREVIVKRYFYREPYLKTCKSIGIGRRTYYRVFRKAQRRLIMKYCLDYYDEYGMERHDWLDLARQRREWNNGRFFGQDVKNWPEFKQN